MQAALTRGPKSPSAHHGHRASQGTLQWEKGKRVPGERATVLGENARSKG